MPITAHFRPEANLIVLVHAGVVSDDEFVSSYKAIYEDVRFDKSSKILVDLRHTESSVRSSATLRRFAEFMELKFKDISVHPKVAVVAPEDVSFGLARMYQVFSHKVQWEFQVFRSTEKALAWLAVTGPYGDWF